MRPARREIRRLKTFLGRVMRDIGRKIAERPGLAPHFAEPMARVTRLLAQQKTDHAKLYALHAPEVECLAKGKAHKRYEFGVKVSIATTNREGLVLGMLALPGNPYDGHTLSAALAQVERMTGLPSHVATLIAAIVDTASTIATSLSLVSVARDGNDPSRAAPTQRHRAVIGHMKADGRLDPKLPRLCAWRRNQRPAVWRRKQSPPDPQPPEAVAACSAARTCRQSPDRRLVLISAKRILQGRLA
jgi:transposase, IS5 family